MPACNKQIGGLKAIDANNKSYGDVGGIRVSTYNAVTVANVETLVSFMDEFVKKNG